MKSDRIWILGLALGLLLTTLLSSTKYTPVSRAQEGAPDMESNLVTPAWELDLGVAGYSSEVTADLGAGFSYQGMLTGAGGAAFNGTCNILFRLYDAASGGSKIGGDSYALQVKVTNGLFTAQANAGNEFGSNAFNGQPRYLQVAVKCNADTGYTYLYPRHTIYGTPYALGLRPGINMVGNAYNTLMVQNTNSSQSFPWGVAGFIPSNPSGIGVYGCNNSSNFEGKGAGVKGYTNLPKGYGVHGSNMGGNAGVLSGAGVYGEGNGIGVKGFSDDGMSMYAETNNGFALYAKGTGLVGDGLKVITTAPRYLIQGYRSDTDNRTFYVTGYGEVYADGSFHPGGADLAEMMPAQDGLQPGDVLVIGEDGRLLRCTQARQTNLAGVYSTKPGILGGAGDDADLKGQVPLAVVGVVPVKVSAENGAIRPGDLLTTSATPGHAMKAGTDKEIGTILGKALGSLARGTGVIKALILLQ